MHPSHPPLRGFTRRDLLRAGLVTGTALSFDPVLIPHRAGAQQPKRGGILRVRGWDPPHFDPHQTRAFMTMTTLSFVYSKLLRHKVGAGVPAGSFSLEPDLAERWEQPDDTTYIFHLRKGVTYHNGRELTSDDLQLSALESFRAQSIQYIVVGYQTPGTGCRPDSPLERALLAEGPPVVSFSPTAGCPVSVFDPIDTYYVPLAGYGGWIRPGPPIRIYRLGG